MKIHSISQSFFTSLCAVLAVTVASVSPVKGATIPVEPQDLQSGVVRALMSTGGDSSTNPFHGMFIETDEGKLPISAKEQSDLVPGQNVAFSISDNKKSIETVEPLPAPVAVTAPITPNRRLLVVPVQWADKPFSNTRLTTLSNTLPPLAAWWSKVSGGVESLTFNVMPVQEVSPTTGCEVDLITRDVERTIKKAKLDTWATNVSMILPDGVPCAWAGLGQWPGDYTWISLIGVGVFAHELGHNIGLAHASTCVGTSTVSLMQPCEQIEYGDPTDVMGNGGESFGFNAAYLKQAGWLQDSKIQTWTGGDQTYVITTLLDANAPVRAIQIPQAFGTDNRAPGEYWIQMHQASRRGASNGVYMNLLPTEEHVAVMSTSNGSPGSNVTSWLCDITTGQELDGDFAFVVGRQWNDPTGRFSINVLAVTATTATIRIWNSSTKPIGTQSISVAHESLDSGQLSGGLIVNWGAIAPASSSETEPLEWVATTAEGQSCTANVRERSCVIRGAARNKQLMVTVVGKNYAGVSVPKTSLAQPLPITVPFVQIKVIADESFIQIHLENLDDGGTPLLSLTAGIGKTNCKLVALSCRVSNLTPNKDYPVVVVARNGMGERRFELTVRTLEDKVLRDLFDSGVLFTQQKTGARTYKIWWVMFGDFSKGTKVRIVMPKINGRSCVRTSYNSCTYRNLVLKKSKKVVIHVYKKGRRSTFHGTKSVRFKK